MRAALSADLRRDVPRYRVFRSRHTTSKKASSTDVASLWRDDFVGFLLGCSFTFETALEAAGLPVRHIQEGRNVPMYRTSIHVPARQADFAGPMVVSMRPYREDQIDASHRSDHGTLPDDARRAGTYWRSCGVGNYRFVAA